MLEKVFMFLAEHKEVAFATVGSDGKPKLRVFQIMKQENTTVYFATAPGKEVHRQLHDNPSIEMLGMEGNISVRISGEASFDVPEEVGKEIYDTNPVLSRLYKAYTDLSYFRVPVRKLDYFDLSTTPPVFKSFNL
ncbi:MAG: pyridoxamine 5'-phosphate oxidase family protein [Tannerellaceae bacterium]|nr:pyridoxamine 5'-phosphate oxidase family protein [Tannerellaceae bacterium]